MVGVHPMRDAMQPEKYARVYGSPGEMARVTGLVRTLWPVLLIVAAAGYLLRAAFPLPIIAAGAAGALCLVLVVAATLVASFCERRFSAYLKGARGEEKVAHALGFLSADYTVFNGLSRGKGDVIGGEDFDHVVVGPTGVYAVETKNWSRPVTVRDNRIFYGGAEPSRPPLEQVTRGAELLRRRLEEAGLTGVPVQGVLCFAERVLVPGACLVDDVSVCTVGDLADVVAVGEESVSLDAETSERIVTLLRQQAVADGALPSS